MMSVKIRIKFGEKFQFCDINTNNLNADSFLTDGEVFNVYCVQVPAQCTLTISIKH